jgi:PAS domain S-box-containing protein
MNPKKKLYKHDRLFQLMADNVLDGVAIIENQKVIYVNNRLCEITGYTRDELHELDSFEIIAPEIRKGLKRDYGDHEKIKLFEEKEYEIVRKDGERRIIYNRHSHMINDADGKIFYHFEIITDITDRKLAEEKLKVLNQELEQRVGQRTAALTETNEQLKKEIHERTQAEKELKFREQELEAREKSLEELNAALRVLLKKGEEDKKDLEEKMLFNVKELVMPYTDNLIKSRLDPHQRECLKVIKSNLNDIISPFRRALSFSAIKLTSREIQIANLIKEGRTTKDIADLLHLSDRTITTHRDNIRKKLGLKAKKANLRTYLSSIL